MSENIMTELFPILAGIHHRGQISIFYWHMLHDANVYSEMHQKDDMSTEIFSSEYPLRDDSDNLKAACSMIDGMVIRPFETFSLFQALRRIGDAVPGITLIDTSSDDIKKLASILFQVFLHTPLTITERHSQKYQDSFSTDREMIRGIDADAEEGTLDLKIRNDTSDAWQIRLNIESDHMNCRILCNHDDGYRYRIANCNLAYVHDDSGIVEQVDVIRERYQKDHPNTVCRKVLYRNSSRLKCQIPEGVIVLQRGSF